MKKVLLFLVLFLSGCSIFEPIEESNIKEKENLKYEIESIRYSKILEQIEPSVNKIEEKDDFIKLSIGLGVTDFKNIDIEKIEKKGSIVTIYVIGEKDKYSTMLSYPNIVLNIFTDNFKPIDSTFLLDNSSLDIYPIKYSLSQAANLLETNLNLSTKSIPQGSLIKDNDKFYWEFFYNGIVDRQDENLGLIDLKAKLNANTGEVIDSSKIKVSERLDYGKILSFKEDEYLYYLKIDKNKQNSNAIPKEIMKYSIKNNEVSKVYATIGDIIDFNISDSGEVAFIEDVNNIRNLFIILPDSNKPYKAVLSNVKQIANIKWLNDNTLYIMDRDINDIHLYEYHVDTSTDNLKATLQSTVKNILPGKINIIIDGISGSNNSNIYSTTDFNNVTKIATGHSPMMFGKYLVFSFYNEVENFNNLYLLDMDNNETFTIDKEVISVSKVNDNMIIYTKNESKESDLNVYMFDIKNKKSNYLANVITKDIYYDSINNSIYKNVYFTLNDIGREIIYRLDIK